MCSFGSRFSSVHVVLCCTTEESRHNFWQGQRLIYSPKQLHWLWDSSSVLSSGLVGSVPVGKAVWVKRRTPTLRVGIFVPHIRLHGVHIDNCNYLAVFTTIYRHNI
jgi:hypothetical protein